MTPDERTEFRHEIVSYAIAAEAHSALALIEPTDAHRRAAWRVLDALEKIGDLASLPGSDAEHAAAEPGEEFVEAIVDSIDVDVLRRAQAVYTARAILGPLAPTYGLLRTAYFLSEGLEPSSFSEIGA